MLRCGISILLTSGWGQNEKPPFLGLCRLRPVADIGARRVSPDKDARPGSPRSGRGGNATHSRQVASFIRVAGGEGGGVFMASLTAPHRATHRPPAAPEARARSHAPQLLSSGAAPMWSSRGLGVGVRRPFRWTRIIQPHSVNLARQSCVLTSYAEPVTMWNKLRSKVIEQSKTICIPSGGQRSQFCYGKGSACSWTTECATPVGWT